MSSRSTATRPASGANGSSAGGTALAQQGVSKLVEYEDASHKRQFPFVSYLFRVDIAWSQGDTHVADFTECSGLGAEVSTDDFEEGGHNDLTRRLPRRAKYTNLSLQRGYVRNSELFRWCMGMLNPTTITRRDVNISLMEMTQAQGGGMEINAVFTWVLRNAFPVKWTGPSLRVDASGAQAIAMERLELAFERMEALQ